MSAPIMHSPVIINSVKVGRDASGNAVIPEPHSLSRFVVIQRADVVDLVRALALTHPELIDQMREAIP